MIKPTKADRDSVRSRSSLSTQTGAGRAKRNARKALLNPWMTVAVLFAGACGIFLLTTRSNNAQNLPAHAKNTGAVHTAKPIRIAENDRSAAAATPEKSRPSLDFYTKGVRDSMFSAPQPPKPKAAPQAKVKPGPPVKVTIPDINPFADWTYSGTVSMGDEKIALLENRTTKEGQYLKTGDDFMGAKVGTISDQMVTLTSGKKPYLLAKSDTINVTPLDKSAPYLTQQAQPGQPGQQGQMGMQMTQMGGQQNGTPAFTLPNGLTLNADQAARFQQRMTGRFNGQRGGFGRGGNGGNGGGGGGRNRGGAVRVTPGG